MLIIANNKTKSRRASAGGIDPPGYDPKFREEDDKKNGHDFPVNGQKKQRKRNKQKKKMMKDDDEGNEEIVEFLIAKVIISFVMFVQWETRMLIIVELFKADLHQFCS